MADELGHELGQGVQVGIKGVDTIEVSGHDVAIDVDDEHSHGDRHAVYVDELGDGTWTRTWT